MGENQKLIDAVERNTHAVRAVAIYLIGFIVWVIAAAVVMGIGLALATTDLTISLVLTVIGLGVLAWGAIQTISRATNELKASESPK